MPSAKRLRQTPFFRSRHRADLVIESFLLKLKITTTCFEQDIFHNNLEGQRLRTYLFLEILPVAIKIGIHYRLLCRNNFIYKKIQEIAPGRVTF